MDNFDWKEIRSLYGLHFEEYCKKKGIFPKKVKCGAYMLPNITNLEECKMILLEHKKKTDLEIDNMLIQNKFINFSEEICNLKKKFKLLKDHKRKLRMSSKGKKMRNVTVENIIPFFTGIQIDVYLQDTTSKLPSLSVSEIPGNYSLNIATNGKEIYEQIMKTYIQLNNQLIESNSSVELVFPILEKFQKQHKKFRYFNIIKNLRNEKQEKALKCKYQVTVKQLQTFFEIVLFKVVPWSLFGGPRNTKKIKKAVFSLITTARYEALNIIPYVTKLKLTNIHWLKLIENEGTKWLILVKLVKWFFNGYIIQILRTHLHVTQSPSSYYERLYIRRTDWRNVQKQFNKEIMGKRIIKPVIEWEGWAPPIGEYKLVAKYSGVRPLLEAKYDKREKSNAKLIQKFLEQLYITEYGLMAQSKFHEQWKLVFDKKTNLQHNKLCFVSCDVADAYGSVIQTELYNMIESLCEHLPNILIIQWYAMVYYNSKEFEPVRYKQYFSDKCLQLSMSSSTLYSPVEFMNSETIQKNWLLNRIQKYIFYQRVQIKNKHYVIGKGIVQGAILSPILSNIYYSFILNKKLSDIMKSGLMLRYMDDILYVTESEESAKKFLNLTKKGILKYNCRFKPSKTQTNIYFENSNIVESINYLGYEIKCATLEIVPKFPKTHPRYMVSLCRMNNKLPLEFFRHKLYNMTILKLSKVALDYKINSIDTITNIIRQAGLLQASRAAILITKLFHDVVKDALHIFKIIKTSNKKILRVIMRKYLTANIESGINYQRWSKEIMQLLWTCYKNVFSKKNILCKSFITLFVAEIYMLDSC